jgi:hypothetical protein
MVSHEGQKQLEIDGTSVGARGTGFEDTFDKIVPALSEMIRENTKLDILSWITPSFSTTTPTDHRFCLISLMSIVKSYFTYKCGFECGFPSITLAGNKNDWSMLITKVHSMQTFEDDTLTTWSQTMIHVLENFVGVFNGQVDEEFWQSAILKAYGSGASDIRGWILAFYPFNTQGKYILRSLDMIKKTKIYGGVDEGEIPMCKSTCDLEVDDNCHQYTLKLLADSCCYRFDVGQNMLTPISYVAVGTDVSVSTSTSTTASE